jgi:hypothetical protein
VSRLCRSTQIQRPCSHAHIDPSVVRRSVEPLHSPLSLCVATRFRRAHEVAAFNESAEPRVLAKRIPFGILRQPDKMHVSRLDGAVEPLEGHIALVKPSVHQRHRVRRNVFLASNAFQRAQHALSFVPASQLREDVASLDRSPVPETSSETATTDRHVPPCPMTPPPRVCARIESRVAGQRMSCGDPEVCLELLRALAEGRNR